MPQDCGWPSAPRYPTGRHSRVYRAALAADAFLVVPQSESDCTAQSHHAVERTLSRRSRPEYQGLERRRLASGRRQRIESLVASLPLASSTYSCPCHVHTTSLPLARCSPNPLPIAHSSTPPLPLARYSPAPCTLLPAPTRPLLLAPYSFAAYRVPRPSPPTDNWRMR